MPLAILHMMHLEAGLKPAVVVLHYIFHPLGNLPTWEMPHFARHDLPLMQRRAALAPNQEYLRN